MYKATLTMTGMLAYPVSASTVTVTGVTAESLVIAGTKPDGLTIESQLTLTQVRG
jgi:hypothetical protein